MSPARYFGYELRADGTVVLTRGCRTVGVVRGDAEVARFLEELTAAAGGRQEALARWAARAATRTSV
ncbi:hypothetical protein [Streptomyces sp. NBC_01353]|uniref:hypothetical protein n=1 Tax=Streptomyces sp. NBC_01353 TaxID=2903835 RepID=UPI002E2FC088|nr:hypothetical protein [Streptomyces sp. NBC_01353]